MSDADEPRSTRHEAPPDASAETTGVTLHRWDDIPREAVTPVIGRKLITGERRRPASYRRAVR